MPLTLLIRSALALFLTVTLLAGCDFQKTIEQSATPEEKAKAQQYITYLQERNIDAIVKVIDPSINNENVHETLVRVAGLVPQTPPLSIKLVGMQSNNINNGAVRTLNLTFEYEFPETWLIANVATKTTSTNFTIIGLTVTQQKTSQESRVAFTLSGKTPRHYITLALACIFTLLTLYAVVACIRTKPMRRKGLWILFILMSLGSYSFNWTTGAWQLSLFTVQILSVSATTSPYGPWIISLSLPVGALFFLVLGKDLATREKEEQNSNKPEQENPPA